MVHLKMQTPSDNTCNEFEIECSHKYCAVFLQPANSELDERFGQIFYLGLNSELN